MSRDPKDNLIYPVLGGRSHGPGCFISQMQREEADRVWSGGVSKVVITDRTAARHKTFERTVIVVNGIASTAHILNLSVTGALIYSGAAIERTAFVTLTVAGREVPSEVMWVDGQRSGVRFDHAVASGIIAAILGHQRPYFQSVEPALLLLN